MKIIIKGDRNVGKTCLLERLQGRSFIEAYTPTEQIQAASIQWSFKATEDVVKVEVWDVVDRGKARAPQPTTLKMNLSAAQQPPEIPALDAEFLDVYKGTHGVIMMMDVTKLWTFEYITRELPKVPVDTPILILGNHCDMSHHRVVSEGQAVGFIEQVQETRTGKIMYGESSMRNGFGLRLLHKFLGLPFLRLQRDTLLAQLERNQRDSEICVFEVNEFLKSDDADYGKFLDQLVNKRRQVADSKSNTKVVQCNPLPSTSATGGQHSSIPELRPTKSIIVGGGQPIVIPGQTNITNDPKFRQSLSAASSSKPMTKIASIQSKIASVEDFCPDGLGGGLGGFLEDVDGATGSGGTASRMAGESDSDEESRGNPLVARFHDDQAEEEEARNEPVIMAASVVPAVRVNPLAKPSKSSSTARALAEFAGASHSDSSTDLEVAVEAESEADKEVDFDSWINDTAQRRSPEGGEDPTTCQVAVSQEPFLSSAKVSHSPTTTIEALADQVDGEAEVVVKKHKKKKSKDGKKDREDKEKKRKKKKSKHDSSDAEDERLDEGMQTLNVSHEDYECI